MKTVANLGDKYGKLTIVEITERRYGSGSVIVLCKCDCGKTKETNLKHLRMGVTASCGCKRKETAFRLPKGDAALNELYSKYRQTAYDRGYSFELSKEEFKKLTSSNCHYCGDMPKRFWQKGRYNGDYVYNGIDRKVNSVGYTIDNSLPCCTNCNMAKASQSYEEFMDWIKRLCLNNMKELTEIC